MKKGGTYEGVVEKVAFPNKGLVRVEDGYVSVKNVIPGQRIRFYVKKKRKGKADGQLLEVLEGSPLEERPPVCGIFPDCGGCLYQTMPYGAQLALKEAQVKELLDGVIQGSYTFEGIRRSPEEFGYRNKMEFSFGDAEKDGPLTLGLHRKGSWHDILTAGDCKLVHKDVTDILNCTLAYFTEKGVGYYHKMRQMGYLRHLMVRRSSATGEILVNLVTTTQEQYDLMPWAERLCTLPLEGRIAGILHILNDSVSDVVQSDETRLLYGQDHFYERLLGLTFKVTPFSFFQPNPKAAEVLYGLVREYLGDAGGMTVYDLYSGTGTIAQAVAAVAKEVIGVEIVEEAVEAARENAALNGIENCRFLAGDVLKALDEIVERPDCIILDPPRDGIHPKALPKILAYGVEKIIYISCKPTSLVRDLAVMQEWGYAVERCVCVDQFVHTPHVESIALLSKLKSNKLKHINVELEMDELDLTAAESKATYEEIRDYVLEHSGLKVSSLYIAQVKQKCGIIERENYILPKSENSRQPKCPPEKEKAIRDALEHFHMI